MVEPAGQYEPGEQLPLTVLRPEAAQNEPEGQIREVGIFENGQYEFRGHVIGAVPLAKQYCPAAHADAGGTADDIPAGQKKPL
jgi:hypothetical protein